MKKLSLEQISDGSQVKIGDVATVNLGVETYNMIPRMNEQTCAIIALYQAPGSNAVELAKNIIAEMDELAKDFPESVKYEVGLDSTLPITAGIKDIIVTLIIALFLVILVVFIFIQDWRATLIPTLGNSCFSYWSIYIFPNAWVYHQCIITS